MNDDRILLASRYLDDDLTADERALVEGDPELLAEMERMRAVRRALADVPVPSDAQRNAAVTAAIAAFDAPAAAPVASLGARRRARWLVPMAAAIVGVLAFGGLASLLANTAGDDDDDSAGEAEILSEAADVTEAGESDEVGGGADTTQSMLAAPADTAAGTSRAGDQAASTEAPGEGSTAGPAASEEALERLATPDDLLQFATRNTEIEATADTTPTAAAETTLSGDGRRLLSLAESCDLGELIGGALYTVDGREEFVIVVVDADEALAVTPTCTVVARAPLP